MGTGKICMKRTLHEDTFARTVNFAHDNIKKSY